MTREEDDNENLPEVFRAPPANPAAPVGYPAGLALELALRVAKPSSVLAAYDISPAEFQEILAIPAFKKEFKELTELAKDEGFSYKMKARAQAEGMLRTTWGLVHDPLTPPAVKADLIKFTARTAGYDKKDIPGEGVTADKIRITINLGDNDVKEIKGTAIITDNDNNGTDVGQAD